MNITLATAADIPLLAAIEVRAQKHPWSEAQFAEELALPQSQVLVARSAAEPVGAVAGYSVTWVVADELQILNICVAPEYRRSGVARALLHKALAGCACATLDVRRGNVEALGLYRSFGFSEDGVRSGYYSDGEDAILMSWRLP